MTTTYDKIRKEIIAKLTGGYKTGYNDRFIDVDELARVLIKTSEEPLESLSAVDEDTFWSLAFRYPAHRAPEWFDPSWIPVYDD